MKLLAIDTATALCSVALYINGEIAERAAHEPRAHADRVLPFVDELLAETGLNLRQLDGLAFGRGPGGFTGLRVAAAVTQGLALGAGLPVAPVSDLAAVAHGAHAARGWRGVLAGLDARMGELYYAAYVCETERVRLVGSETLAAPAEVELPAEQGGSWHCAGPGWPAYADALPDAVRLRLDDFYDAPPRASSIAVLAAAELRAGRAVAPEDAVPVYLRDRVAEKPA
jgi:tRNA threonylcarbamoyladenosine biosynthesis protein TsaB